MYFYFEPCEKSVQKFRGRPRTTIVSTLNDDIKRLRNDEEIFMNTLKQLESTDDLNFFRRIAENRKNWKKLVDKLYEAAKAERFFIWHRVYNGGKAITTTQ